MASSVRRPTTPVRLFESAVRDSCPLTHRGGSAPAGTTARLSPDSGVAPPSSSHDAGATREVSPSSTAPSTTAVPVPSGVATIDPGAIRAGMGRLLRIEQVRSDVERDGEPDGHARGSGQYVTTGPLRRTHAPSTGRRPEPLLQPWFKGRQPRSTTVAFGEQGSGYGPRDRQAAVVPSDGDIKLRLVRRRHLVKDLGAFAEGQEP